MSELSSVLTKKKLSPQELFEFMQRFFESVDACVFDCGGVRVGINSGSAAIGNAGSKRHFNYTVIGEAVNFTQRLEAACPAGKVLVGRATYELASDHLQFQAMEMKVKNERETQRAYLVEDEIRV